MDTPDSDPFRIAHDLPPVTQLLGVEEGSPEYLYLEMAPILHRIAAFTFHVPDEDAATLVHDVFITYLANRRGVRSNARAYLIGGIRNASRKYWRTRHSARRVFTDDEVRAALARPEVAAVLVPDERRDLLQLDLTELTYG